MNKTFRTKFDNLKFGLYYAPMFYFVHFLIFYDHPKFKSLNPTRHF